MPQGLYNRSKVYVSTRAGQCPRDFLNLCALFFPGWMRDATVDKLGTGEIWPRFQFALGGSVLKLGSQHPSPNAKTLCNLEPQKNLARNHHITVMPKVLVLKAQGCHVMCKILFFVQVLFGVVLPHLPVEIVRAILFQSILVNLSQF